jgi:PAS domain S-box-containing protein
VREGERVDEVRDMPTSPLVAEPNPAERAELALRESEARTRAILNSAIDCVVAMDRDGLITEFNQAAEVTFGYRRQDVIGKPLVETIIPPSLRAAHRKGLQHFLATGEARALGSRLQLTGMRADGTEFPVEVAIALVEGSDPPLFTGHIRDTTKRKQREEEAQARAEEVLRLNEELERRVAERTEELEASNRELEAFSYSVSHDLRAPLRAIDGFSKILVNEFGTTLPERAREYLDIVREGAQQMGRLIDDLLAFARMGRQTLGRRDVDTAELVRRSLDQLRGELNEREVDVRIGDLPNSIADPAMLQQVYVNLLANALKFTRTRSPAVVEVGLTQAGDRQAFFVKDNGVGFDMRYADKLFGVFQRMHRAEDYEGTGVGLAIVQRVIHRHGGRVWADAEPDKGATFFFTLGDDRGDA